MNAVEVLVPVLASHPQFTHVVITKHEQKSQKQLNICNMAHSYTRKSDFIDLISLSTDITLSRDGRA